MQKYSCTNSEGYRFTLSATSAHEALDRAITQFIMHGQCAEPIIAASLTDPCDYYSTHQLKDSYLQAEFEEAEVLEALNQLDTQAS